MHSYFVQQGKSKILRSVAAYLLILPLGGSYLPAAEAELPWIKLVHLSQEPPKTGKVHVKVKTIPPRAGKFSKSELESIEILVAPASSVGAIGTSENRWKPIVDGVEFSKISLVGGPLPKQLDLARPLVYQLRYRSKDGTSALSEPGVHMPEATPSSKSNASVASIDAGVAKMVVLETATLEKELSSANHLSQKHRALFAGFESSGTLNKIALPGPEVSVQKTISTQPIVWIGEAKGGLLAITRSEDRGSHTVHSLDPVTLTARSSFKIPASSRPAASPGSPFLFLTGSKPGSSTKLIEVVEGTTGKFVGRYEISKLIDEMEASTGISSKEHRYYGVDSTALSPDGRWLYLSDRCTKCFRVIGGRPVFSGISSPNFGVARGFKFSEDGSMFATRSQQEPPKWKIFENGDVHKPLAEIMSEEPFFAFQPQSELLLCFGGGSGGFFTPGSVRVAAIHQPEGEDHIDTAWSFAAGERCLIQIRKKLILMKFDLPHSN